MPSSYRLLTLDLDDTLWPCVPPQMQVRDLWELHAWLIGAKNRP